MNHFSRYLACALALTACSDTSAVAPPPTEVRPAPIGSPYDTLQEWGLFADTTTYTPAARVEPYQVISPLYSDYTHKRRFMWIPPATTIGYHDDELWKFPVGTILVKTFGYLNDMRDESLGERKLEVRLLVRESSDSWEHHIYVWDEAQAVATREVAGNVVTASWIDIHGESRSNDYIVPNTNECQECHGKKADGLLDTLGGRTRQLDRDGQLEKLQALGWLDNAPSAARQTLVDPFGQASLSDRVRSYLDANCGHCHKPDGQASQSALLLDWKRTDPTDQDPANWGVCKQPTSAGGATCGHVLDIVPGDADSSIFMCRLESDDPKVRMPPLVSRLPHDEGVQLVREWINSMDPPGCSSM